MRGSRDRIEPIYFQHQIFDFFSFFSGATLIFWLSLGPPGVPGPKIVKIIFIYFTESGKLESGGCRDTGSRNRQPAASARGNGFSVLRISTKGADLAAWGRIGSGCMGSDLASVEGFQ